MSCFLSTEEDTPQGIVGQARPPGRGGRMEAGFDESYVGNLSLRWADMIGFYGAELLPELCRVPSGS